jgi:ribonuclease P/MRP protein subunit POP5
MKPYYESYVICHKEIPLEEYIEIATNLKLKGFVIEGKENKQLKAEKSTKTQIISRKTLSSHSVNSIRKLLAQNRFHYELLAVEGTNYQVAQWVAKDNRVDIIRVPSRNMRKIITPQLASVTAECQTFIELDLQPLFDKKFSNNSFYFRLLRESLNTILLKRAPFLLTCSVAHPLDFRDRRMIYSLAEIIGIPSRVLNDNYQLLTQRLKTNREKLAREIIAPGIKVLTKKAQKNEKIKKSDLKEKEWKEKDQPSLELESLTDEELKQLTKSISIAEQELPILTLERPRYISFETITTANISLDKKKLQQLFWSKFSELYGTVGSSKAGLYLLDFSNKTMTGILRCSHMALQATRVILGLITEYQEKRILLKINRVSGTLKGIRKE